MRSHCADESTLIEQVQPTLRPLRVGVHTARSRQCGQLITGNAPRARHMPPTVAATEPNGSVCAMSIDLENLTASFGLVRREFRDVHAAVSHLDASMAAARHVAGPSARDLITRVAVCHVVGRQKTKAATAMAAEYYHNDPTVLKALASPGMIGRCAPVRPRSGRSCQAKPRL